MWIAIAQTVPPVSKGGLIQSVLSIRVCLPVAREIPGGRTAVFPVGTLHTMPHSSPGSFSRCRSFCCFEPATMLHPVLFRSRTPQARRPKLRFEYSYLD